MAELSKKRQETLIFWLATYPLNFVLGCIFTLLRLVGLIRIVHPERIPRDPGAIIIAPNHRSYWEAVLMPAIFFPWSMLHPRKGIPWCVLDPRGFKDNVFFKALSPRFIMVPRDNRRGMAVALLNMIDVVRNGDRVILYPEGTRLHKAAVITTSSSGHHLGELQGGIATLVKQTSASILPIWVDGSERIMPDGAKFPRFWRRMTLVIGEPLYFEAPANLKGGNAFIVETVTRALFILADEIS